MKYVDLFSGLGGFHLALDDLGHSCVFACEIENNLRECYFKNFGLKPMGDISKIDEKEIPKHDILCAGFPCHTIPSAQYYAISIFEMSGEKPFKDYFTNTLASGGIEIDDRGRKNIFWIAEKKQGYVLANGRIQGEEDGIKVVLSDYPNKIHAFPISSSSLLVRKCINCGKDIVF